MNKLICSFSKPLHSLFCTLSNKCVFPSTWNVSEIVLIFKAGNEEIVFNYCPMNVLTVTPNALVKLMFDKLIFSSELIISSSHYGFRQKESKITVRNLIEDQHEVFTQYGIPETNCQTCLFLDFQKFSIS